MEGSPIVLDLLRDVALPAVTAVMGWFASIWRTKQRKEKDVLENVSQILEIQKQYIADQDEENRKTREYNRHLERKLDDKRASISKANKCKYTNEDDGCPVLAHEESLDEKCRNCEIRQQHDKSED